MAHILSTQIPLNKQRNFNAEEQYDGSILPRTHKTNLSDNLYNARISNDLRKKVVNGNATGIIMSRLPKRPPVDIEFDEISFGIPDKSKKGNKIILNSVSGSFRSGRLTAIMGPSGAGKSTLMNIAAGYKCSNVVGSILVNGNERDPRRFRKMSCYIMQEDHLHPHLSVNEVMNISANLKLGSTVTAAKKEVVISEILETLNLQDSRDTRSNNLSGGQKKRLSIALELVNNPPVMFFDEPTSGLDSSSSFQVISLLKTLALGGRTIICTIHQPSAKLFEKFDHLFALAEGQCIYHGAICGLIPFLSVMGLDCPSYHNPADFLMEVASGDYGDYIHKLNTGVRNGKCENFGMITNPLPCQTKGIDNGEENFANRNSLLSDSVVEKISPVDKALLSDYNNSTRVHLGHSGSNDLEMLDDDITIDDIPDSFPTSSWTQFVILFKRSFLSSIRDGILTKLRVSSHICTGLLIGALYFNVGNEASKVFNNSGSLFFCMMFLMFTAMMPTILTFPLELKIFMREHLNYWYSMKSYYLAMTFADFPFQLTYPILYVGIAYFMTNQPIEFDRFCMVTSMCIMTSLVAQSLGLVIGAGMDVQAAVFLGPISSIPILLFSGFFVTFTTMPVYLRWISYISYIRYGFEGILISVYGYDREKLHCGQPYCHFKSPRKFLSELDMENASFWFNFGMLWVFFIIVRIFGYFVLKWRLKALK